MPKESTHKKGTQKIKKRKKRNKRNSCIITNQLSQTTDDGTRSPSRVIKINLKCQNGAAGEGGAQGEGEGVYKESQEGQWTVD